jgi:hypothetical protein
VAVSKIKENPMIKMYKTVILPVVLYGCETWSLSLRAEHRLRVFENSVLRKTDHGENCIVLHSLYSSPYIFKVR